MNDDFIKKRYLFQKLPSSNQRCLMLITGARQTGKTTLVQWVYPDLRYLNLDAFENREFICSLPRTIWAKNVGAAVIDEAQKEPVVFEKIKYAFDARELDFSVLLGSS